MVHVNMTTSLHQQLLQENSTKAGQKGQPFTCPAVAYTCMKLPPLPMNKPLTSYRSQMSNKNHPFKNRAFIFM